jgi:transcriptional regulator with XRE-family HTH domain
MHGHIDTAWFRQQIADSPYGSQRRIAREFPLDPSSLSLMLRGKRKMTLEEAQQLAGLLKVPLDEVLRHAGLKLPEFRAYPIIGSLDADGVFTESEEAVPAPGPDTLPPDAKVVQVRADGAVADGWLLFIEAARSRPTPQVYGRLALARIAKGPVVLAHARRGYRPGALTLEVGVPWGAGRLMKDAPVEWASPVLLIQP